MLFRDSLGKNLFRKEILSSMSQQLKFKKKFVKHKILNNRFKFVSNKVSIKSVFLIVKKTSLINKISKKVNNNYFFIFISQLNL